LSDIRVGPETLQSEISVKPVRLFEDKDLSSFTTLGKRSKSEDNN